MLNFFKKIISRNKRAFIFAINDNYSFLLATTLLSLKENSPAVFSSSDYIVYTEDVSETNKKLLNQITSNIIFKTFSDYTNIPSEIYSHKLINSRWGKYVLCKLGCFGLLKRYDQLVCLDVDMLITSDISAGLNFHGDILYTEGPYLYAAHKKLKHPKDFKDRKCCQGGTVVFNKGFLKYKIDESMMREAYKNTVNCNTGGIEEALIDYLVVNHDINYGVLPLAYNDYMLNDIENASIVHFSGVEKCPWKSGLAYQFFPDWGRFYKKWLNMGGTGPEINHSNNDFYNKGYCFFYVKYTLDFLDILRDLDILKNPVIITEYTTSSCAIKFYIKGVYRTIHYKLVIYNGNVSVSLNCESTHYLTSGMKNMFEEIYGDLSKRIRFIKITQGSSSISIAVGVPRYMINSTMNLFVKHSLERLTNHLL